MLSPARIGQKILSELHGDVLDFGCGQNSTTKQSYRIRENNYYTLDADSFCSFDFSALSDIPTDQKFVMVVMNQAIEHIPFREQTSKLSSCANCPNAVGLYQFSSLVYKFDLYHSNVLRRPDCMSVRAQ
jgi:hypothetical protein